MKMENGLIKCSICLGSGKFEGYICYKCGGGGKYFWIEEMVGIDPKRKFEIIREKIEEKFYEIFGKCDGRYSMTLQDEYDILKRAMEIIADKHFIYDYGFNSTCWGTCWVQLHSNDRRYSIWQNEYV